MQPSNINVVHSHEERQNAPFDFAEQNRKYTLGTQNVNSTDNGVGTSSAATHQDTSSSGNNLNHHTNSPLFNFSSYRIFLFLNCYQV